MPALNPQQQEWYQKFLAQRQQSFAQQLQSLHGMQPWQQPGWTRQANPLMARSPIPGYQESDPTAGTAPFFLPEGGTSFSTAQEAPMNPMLMQMLLSGSTGFGGM